MTTVVTCFFDLQKIEGTNRRPIQVYLEHGKSLCNQDINLIIYTQPELVDTIENMRSNYKNKTKIISIEFKDIHYYKYYDILEQNRRINPLQNLYPNPIKDTLNYQILNLSKIPMVKQALDENPFNTSHFCWCDFGIAHVSSFEYVNIDNVFNTPCDKIKFMSCRAFNPEKFKDLKEYYKVFHWNFAGGFFKGPGNLINDFCNIFEKLLLDALNNQLCPIDEQLFSVSAYQNPQIFDPFYGDYRSIMSNYLYFRKDINMVIWYLKESLLFKDINTVQKIKNISNINFGGSINDKNTIDSL